MSYTCNYKLNTDHRLRSPNQGKIVMHERAHIGAVIDFCSSKIFTYGNDVF